MIVSKAVSLEIAQLGNSSLPKRLIRQGLRRVWEFMCYMHPCDAFNVNKSLRVHIVLNFVALEECMLIFV